MPTSACTPYASTSCTVDDALRPRQPVALIDSTFPGVYDTTQEEIEKYSEVYFKEHNL